jgi:hypothetical protein
MHDDELDARRSPMKHGDDVAQRCAVRAGDECDASRMTRQWAFAPRCEETISL